MGSWFERNARLLLALVGGLMVVAGISWWLFFYQARYTVVPSPVSASITIDGQAVTAGQRVKLKPGQHTLKVALADFIPLTQPIRARSGQYLTLPVSLRAVPHLQSATRDRVTGVAIDATTHAIRYINQGKGEAEQVSLAADGKPGSPVALSPASSLPSVDEWLWGPSLDLGLFHHGDKWTLYNFGRADLVHQSTTDWPDGVGSVSWSPIASPSQAAPLIHFNAPSGGEQTLVQTDPLHSTTTRLIDLRGSGISDPTVAWVGDGTSAVLLSKDGRLWRFVLYSRSLTPITTSEAVDGFVASPSGQLILAHTGDQHLFVIGIDGKNKRPLAETGAIAGSAWSPDSSAIWLVGSSNGLGVQRIVVGTDRATSYATAPTDSVGTLSRALVTSDERSLVLAGSQGLATLSLTPADYPAVSAK